MSCAFQVSTSRTPMARIAFSSDTGLNLRQSSSGESTTNLGALCGSLSVVFTRGSPSARAYNLSGWALSQNTNGIIEGREDDKQDRCSHVARIARAALARSTAIG